MSALLADVEAWCREVLPVRRPMHLLNVRPTPAELATHPGSLHIQAYFAGARFAAGEQPQAFPRPLTADEADAWSEGHAEHAAEVRVTTTSTSSCPTRPGFLAIDADSWQAHRAGPAGTPALEAS